TGSEHSDFGSKGNSFEFPCGLPNVDRLPIRFQVACQQLLSDEAVYISQADVWIKRPKPQTRTSNDDQRIHCDFGNNIIVPPEWHTPTAVAIIVYFDGEKEC